MSVLRLVTSDREWAERLRGGDHAAFEAAFRAYYSELCAFAYRYLRSPALAEEAVHDVFAELWRMRERLEVRESLKAFLYGGVRHRAISLLRRQAIEHGWQAQAAREQLASPDYSSNRAPDQLEREDLIAAIDRVLADLPARCHTALVLRWQREMSYAEIAETMQISVKTVEAHLTRAAKALRAHLPSLLPDLAEK